MPATDRPLPRHALPNRAELLAALSLAIDLGLGQPMQHMLRACVIAARLCDQLRLTAETRGRVIYATLVAWIGCLADSPELSALFGDDIAFRSATFNRDARGFARAQLMLAHAGSAERAASRGLQVTRFITTGRPRVERLVRSHWASARTLSQRLGLDPQIGHLLGFLFERWDGGGLPQGARGDEIPLEMRIIHLADTLEVFLREGGEAAATSVARRRRATQFDPDLVDAWCDNARELSSALEDADVWTTVLAAAPDDRLVDEHDLDEVLAAMGDFADLRSPYTARHSRAVAQLAERAAGDLGLDRAACAAVRRAGLVHDLGRIGVSATVWNNARPLTATETERIRLYPYVTQRILSRVPALTEIATLAGAHRERLDGSGYTRGLTAEHLDERARVLAAADCSRTWREPRPHRAALTADEVRTRMHAEVAAGRIDGDAAAAVLGVADGAGRTRLTPPSGLTRRERDVLRLLVRGKPAHEIAAELGIAPKTARNHLEHIYTKLGVSNRVGATLYAVQHGLVDADWEAAEIERRGENAP